MRSTLRLNATRLLRTPRWTLPILLTLVVAIGATAAIFAVMDAVFLKSYPYREPERLVVLHDQYRGMDKADLGLAEPEFFDYAEATRELESLGAFRTGRATVSFETAERFDAAWVSADLLRTLGVQPRIGRGFTAEETGPGGPPVALVSHRLWQQRMSSRTDLREGAVLRINEKLVQVVGVLPEDFRLPSDLTRSTHTDLFFPLALNPADMGSRENPVLSVVGRLAPHSSVSRARREQDRIVSTFRQAHAKFYPEDLGYAMTMRPLPEEVVGDVKRSLLVVGGAVGLLFLVALGNASGLILARVDDRRQELGIRVALGARFTQLFRSFVSESFVLALAASIPGIILAYLLCHFLLSAHREAIPRLGDLAVDRWVLLFVAAAATVIVLVFAIASTTRIARSSWARRTLSRDAPASASGTRPGSGRRFLVGGQIALTVALTVGAAFLVSSYRNLLGVDLGFSPGNILVVDLSLPSSRYDTPSRVTSFFGSLRREIGALPGVESAALVTFLPLDSSSEVWPIELKDKVAGRDAVDGVDAQVVSADYFRTLRIPVRSGRDFQPSDDAGTPVVIVDEAFARQFFPSESPLGRSLRARLSPDAPWATIVAVVGSTRHGLVTEDPRPHVYFLDSQVPLFAGAAVRSMQVVVRTRAAPEGLIGPVRAAIWSQDRDLALGSVRTLDEVVSRATSRFRFPMQLIAIFAVMALVVSLSGIYGLISQLVTGSMRDIGIRIALGATPRRILAFVLRSGMVLTVIGVLVGLAVAVGLTRLAAHLLFGISAGQVSIYLGVGIAVTTAAAIACLLPARRAAALDPNRAIRDDQW